MQDLKTSFHEKSLEIVSDATSLSDLQLRINNFLQCRPSGAERRSVLRAAREKRKTLGGTEGDKELGQAPQNDSGEE